MHPRHAGHSIAVYETLSVPFATSHFDSYTSERAGFAVSSAGALGVLALLCMGPLGRLLTDTQMIKYGSLTMVVGTGCLVHFGDHTHFPPARFEAAVFMLYSVGYPIGERLARSTGVVEQNALNVKGLLIRHKDNF